MSIHPTRDLGRCLCDHGPVDVRTWRLCWLIEAGFDQKLAEDVADTTSVDLHALLELVDRGCPPALAARILSPLPAESARRP
ncbi:MAG TPA: hypothetical protein VFO98_10460 [Marmoricola sp.]|nr:hypothetical protein [Marmoricola sp.]